MVITVLKEEVVTAVEEGGRNDDHQGRNGISTVVEEEVVK